jgi:catalase
VDPNAFLNQFEATFGKFEGYRRSGAKGICATGEFVGTADARGLSSSPALQRPAGAGGGALLGGRRQPQGPRQHQGPAQHGAAVQPARWRVWQMGNISAPVFGSSSPQQFLGRLASLQPDPATKMPDPAKVKAFADANPEVLLQGRHFASQPVPASSTAQIPPASPA